MDSVATSEEGVQSQHTPGSDPLIWADLVPGSDRQWMLTRWATVEGMRMVLGRTPLRTEGRGWAALDEVDEELAALGYERAAAWELGSAVGYVARLEVIPAIAMNGWADA